MNIPCELVLNQCLPCNDDPIRNITAEDPDVDIFIGFSDFRGNPPLNILYAQIGCKSICFSATSQREANDCAQRQAAECVFNTWRPINVPPIPPPPDGGGNGPNTPGRIPPANPRNNRLPSFRNRAQSCTVFCPDGTPFVEDIAAGTVVALTQIGADEMAKSLACKRAEVDKLCINSDLLPGVCLGTATTFQFAATGGLPFSDGSYIWNFFGNLPPGITLDGSTGVMSGTPSATGDSLFEIEVSDANGNSTTKIFTLCVMDIVTDATLPNATAGTDYTQPLLEEPADVASEVWSLVGGTLPVGLTLNAVGSITGTPEELDDPTENEFTFTVKCVATCGTGEVTCQKEFTLTVDSVDCEGHENAIEDLVWTDTSLGGGVFNMVGGDGTFSLNLPNPQGSVSVEARCDFLCNPKLDPYDITIEFNWTVAGHVFLDESQASFFMNGVNHDGTLFPGSGARSQTHVVTVNSGVNTNLRLYVPYGGIGVAGNTTISGTVTIRPLTPP